MKDSLLYLYFLELMSGKRSGIDRIVLGRR